MGTKKLLSLEVRVPVVSPPPPILPAEDKLWLKPEVDLQAYEDPAQGALDFTQELDPGWLIVDTVIGEGEPRRSPVCGSTELRAGWPVS